MNITEKTAIVTGGSRGIGRAIAVELAKAGVQVAIIYAGNTAAAEETLALVKAQGVQGMMIQCDVADGAAVEAMVKEVKDTFGSIDILVNNAGITRDTLLMRMKETEWQEVLDTNLTGVFHCTRQVSKLMIKQRHGIIINLTSIVGLVGNAGQANYSAAKAGIIGFTKAVAKELASRNIRVNAIAPGFIETDMTAVLSDTAKEDILKTIPMGRMAKPEEVATVAAFLASEEAKYMTGQVLHVDGGMIM
ncbi:3-oxoacyl-[acyl-carrier-protein] reductase [uncultured Megasphaera sp.]|uniref:3-oxoacyl-[acyl-carrier-protein] reductase n=1 Tax=uncultured Megasphaera sp. TaxID=165188 RepID=UPI00259634DB|nr:3-oxoacyl-[acyl-carrier-protein] reductase [uncultured Megasphaera sp.]